ncbi:MAG: hypothetical protein ACE5J5_07340 [Candidatus Hydrothermarchaeales archaeon]
MKVKAKVILTDTNSAKKKIILECNDKTPKEGTMVTVSWGRIRSLKQNALYWTLLTWYIEHGGMKDQGYMFPEELHEALKGRLLSHRVEAKGGFETRVIGSTSDLTSDEYMEYIEKCEHLLQEYCGVSAAGFWIEYAQNYASSE